METIYNYIDIKKIRELSKEEIPTEERSIFNFPVIINVGRVENSERTRIFD
ncbi:MAG: hypothetical protein Q9M89_01125 [Persephonella sp.]|nr:hypothetical protein [Persephonella sp.]